MQKPEQGALVLARRRRWRVEDVRLHDGCAVLTLEGAEPATAGTRTWLLSPFDTVEPVERRITPRRVSRRRWRFACRALLADSHPPGALRTARTAAIDLLPYQLAPALAVVRGAGARVLLADDVGLGKTVQAGLIVAELRARGAADRVLILTPAGLREQWRDELRSRVGLDAAIMSARESRRVAASLPIGLNPWIASPMAIASTDYVKRAEVLPAIASCLWDVLVVDEAHAVAGDSERRRAVDMLARRAVFVVLLSATPHSGDPDAFRALCHTGSSGDPLIVFRRTRSDASIPARRKVRRLHIRRSPAERRMHVLLARFIDRVASERGEPVRLLASVLEKRACSSAWALERSIERRLAALSTNNVAAAEFSQLALPLDDAGELSGEDDVPSWHPDVRLDDPRLELELLEELLESARAAAGSETKIAAIVRLLRRTREAALVFTEYRDTLLHLAAALPCPSAVLHGGLGRAERAAALNRFSRAEVDLLLATDAAGEGLNLQQRCRLVVNVELPWNPMRLEQRIGRVDRIGQRRTVHAVHLIARDSIEVDVLKRLRGRVDRAQREIGAANPLDANASAPGGAAADAPAPTTELRRLDLHDAAEVEAHRLALTRRIGGARRHRMPSPASTGPWIARTRRAKTRVRLQGSTLTIVSASLVDGQSRVAESTLIGVLASDPSGCVPVAAAAEHLASWQRSAADIHERFISCRIARERSRLAVADTTARDEVQPGLFDRRTELAQAASEEDRRLMSASSTQRIATLHAARRLDAAEPIPVLVLVP